MKNAGLILLQRDNLVLMGMEGPSSGWERQGWWQAYELRSRSKADLNPTSLLTERPVNLDKHISALPSSRHRPTVPLLRPMMPRRRRRPMPRQRRRLPTSPASVALRLEKNEACMRVFHEFARDVTCAHLLALLPYGKKAEICVGDVEIVKHSSWSDYRCRSLIGRVNDHERTDEANFQGEFNAVPGRREQSNQCPEHTIRSSILADLIFARNLRRRAASSDSSLSQRSS